jgi:hypothetical protein
MAADPQLTLDLMAEDMTAAKRRARTLSLALRRGRGPLRTDLYIPYTAPDGEKYLLRLRCDGYNEQAPSFQFVNPDNVEDVGAHWWPRMADIGYPRGDRGEVVYCTPGIREYHQHGSHRQESHPKETWKLSRVIALAWRYLNGRYVGRGVT